MNPARIVARREGDATVLSRAQATSPLRLVRPTFPGTRATALCLVTFGGGLVDGDAIDAELEVQPGATLVVYTQAPTKVFRGASRQSLRADVRGTLVLAVDPVACFAGARYTQRIDVALRDGGRCVMVDGYTSGRAAYGERWAFERLDLCTTISREGRVVLRDATLLDARDGSIGARMGRFDAFLGVLAIDAAPAARAILDATRITRDAVVASSPVAGAAGCALARIAAVTPSRALAEARRALGNLAEIDAVDPWASRH